jgi:hypothetical protein
MASAAIDPRSFALGAAAAAALGQLIAFAFRLARRPPRLLRRLWIWLTYWKVVCSECGGTGVCQQPRAKDVHSCCGDCDRISLPRSKAPPGWHFSGDEETILIGDGVMWLRPWSRRQVRRP